MTADPRAEIRREMRQRRRALPPEERARVSAAICARLLARADVASAAALVGRPLAVYLASPQEIDLDTFILAMLDRGVPLVAPRWNGERYELARLPSLSAADLRTGPMGIREPVVPSAVQPAVVALWIVPGLAFTPAGDRLGYGGGWYDRLLADADDDAPRLGVAYAFQVVPNLPRCPHDIPLTGLVT